MSLALQFEGGFAQQSRFHPLHASQMAGWGWQTQADTQRPSEKREGNDLGGGSEQHRVSVWLEKPGSFQP